MAKNILITGGAGYIGSHTAELLLKKKYNVFILDNLSTGYKKLINNKSKFINNDLKKTKLIKKILIENKITSVIHLAASLNVNESQKKPIKYINNNVKNTLNLLNALRGTYVTKFIFASTAAVYKDGISKVNESSPLRPKSVYGKTKLRAELLIKKILKNKKIKFAILRYFNVCGASNSNKIGQINSYDLLFKNLSSSVLKKNSKINIYGNNYKTKDGTCIRDYIHVLDLAEIHLKLIKKIKFSTVFNCGYNFGRTVLEIVQAFQKHSKKKIKINYLSRRKADLDQIIADNRKLKKTLNWKPKYNNLSLMVKSSIKWEKSI